MKWLFVVTDMNPGGITVAAVNICNELIKRGHQVSLLNFSGTSVPEELDQKVALPRLCGSGKYWDLQMSDLAGKSRSTKIKGMLLGGIKKLTVRSGLWYRLIFRRNKEHYDAAVAFRQCVPTFSYVLNKVSADKKIGFVHCDPTYLNDCEYPFVKRMPHLDRVAYVSDGVRKLFVAKYPFLAKNASTVYNFFDADQIQALAQESNPLSFPPGTTNIVTVARVTNWDKQIQWIPEIAAKLVQNGNIDFHWYIVGDGTDRKEDEALAQQLNVSEYLTFAGHQNNPYCILNDADFMVLTSRTEAYPMVVIESLILKKPVVTTEYPAAREMIRDGETGRVAPVDVDGMTAAVTEMLNNENGVLDHCRQTLSGYRHTNEFAYEQLLQALGAENV